MQTESVPRSWADVLETMANKDPRLHELLEFMRKYKTTDIDDTKRQNSHNRNEGKTVLLRKEYQILVQRNNQLAFALGACQYCWGTDPTCDCKGQGSVGSRVPDKAAFTELVVPVLSRLGIAITEDPNLNGKEKDG